MVFATIFSMLAVPVHAEGGGMATDASNYWEWIARNHTVEGNTIRSIFDSDVCPKCPDTSGRHNFVERHTTVDGQTGNFYVCEYCGKSAGEVGADAYNNYVQELPANQIDSSGRMSLIIDGWHDYYDGGEYSQLSESSSSTTSCTYIVTKSIGYYQGNHAYNQRNHPVLSREFSVPVDGKYSLIIPRIDALASCNGGSLYVKYKGADTWLQQKNVTFGRVAGNYNGVATTYSPEKQVNIDLYANQTYRLEVDLPTDCWSDSSPGKQLWCKASDYYKLVLFQSYSPSTYPQLSLDYRPTSISAPVYYTDNSGQVNVTTGDVHLFSENDMTLTNPQNGTTSTVTDWSYDYSSRTYDLTLDTGEHSTVTYGDENITIKEGDTTYIYNYYVQPTNDDPNGGGNSDPEHKHDYTREITRQASCTVAGQETYTCECGDTYTKSIPALGHDWLIKEQVNSEYDENGEETTKGYTIYKCSRCGEEKKSTDGTPPDSGGGAGKPSIWQKLGDLFGAIGNGLIETITAFIGKILDGLIALAEVIVEKLTAIVEMVLGWFDSLPQMFEGFLAFLASVFGFLPPEIVILMTFGFALVIFIGIIKAIRR